MHWWKVRRNSDTKILSEKIIYLGDKSNSDNLEYIYIYVFIKLTMTSMLNCNQFSMWRKNTDEKEKEREKRQNLDENCV